MFCRAIAPPSSRSPDAAPTGLQFATLQSALNTATVFQSSDVVLNCLNMLFGFQSVTDCFKHAVHRRLCVQIDDVPTQALGLEQSTPGSCGKCLGERHR